MARDRNRTCLLILLFISRIATKALENRIFPMNSSETPDHLLAGDRLGNLVGAVAEPSASTALINHSNRGRSPEARETFREPSALAHPPVSVTCAVTREPMPVSSLHVISRALTYHSPGIPGHDQVPFNNLININFLANPIKLEIV